MIKKIVLRFALPTLVVGGGAATAIIVPIYLERKRHSGSKTDVQINIRIPDFEKATDFAEDIYSPNEYIRSWYGKSKAPKMVPYKIDRKYSINVTEEYTLGSLMEEINSKENEKIFYFNIESRVLAGPMGRMLYGVKKSDDEIQKQEDKIHNTYWGIHEEKSGNNWIKKSDENYSYLSLSSPNNEYARSDSHKYFDLNETYWTYDERSSKGIDQIYLSTNDVININLWRMV